MAAMAAFTFSSCEDVPEPYTQPTKPDAGGTTEGEPKGTGTAADPFNSIAAINYCKTLEAGVESDKEVYIKGKVVSIKEQFSTSFGNGSFYIADDETSEKFYIFRSLYLGNKKWTASDPELKEGDEVVVCAKVMNYMGNTPETVANKTYLVSLNGKTADGSGSGDITGTAKGDGSEANPFNSVAAQKYTAALASGVVSDKEFYIKGKVQSIKDQFSATYGNGSFYIADDANSTQFYIFRIYYFGGEKWKEGDMTLKEGDEIVVCAKLINYMGNTPETNQGGKLISVNGKTSAGGGEVKPDPDPTPDPTPGTSAGITINDLTVTLANSGVTAGESLKIDDISALKPEATLTEIKLSDGTAIAFDKSSGTNAPAYNAKAKELRIYANNKMTFTASKPIAKIIFTCTYDSNKKWNAVGNETATVVFSGNTATYTNTFDGTGGGVQLRIAKMEIVYAK